MLTRVGFLLFRVLKTGSDTRFDDIRSHFFKFLGQFPSLFLIGQYNLLTYRVLDWYVCRSSFDTWS
jgi:hypothetical protein